MRSEDQGTQYHHPQGQPLNPLCHPHAMLGSAGTIRLTRHPPASRRSTHLWCSRLGHRGSLQTRFARSEDYRSWPISAPTLAGRRGRFRGHSFLAGCDGSRQFMTQSRHALLRWISAYSLESKPIIMSSCQTPSTKAASRSLPSTTKPHFL